MRPKEPFTPEEIAESEPTKARMEKGRTIPQIDTVLKVLAPLGKTLAVVPLQEQ